MSKELSEYPKELTEGRNAVEASFIFCLWKQPDLYSDYSSINENNELVYDWKKDKRFDKLKFENGTVTGDKKQLELYYALA